MRYEISSVVYHPITGYLAGIGKLPALAGWYPVGIFVLKALAGTPLEDFVGTLFLKIPREILFSQKGS